MTCQMLADITGRNVETVENTKDTGSMGAALLVAVGSGVIGGFDDIDRLVPVKDRFVPDPDAGKVYDRNYSVFVQLYRNNKKNFAMLNTVHE